VRGQPQRSDAHANLLMSLCLAPAPTSACPRTPPLHLEGILQRWLRMDFGIELDKSKVGVKMVRLLRALWAVLAAKHCGSHRKSAILK